MGIGINKNKGFEEWETPLIGFRDYEWSDNTWIVDHLRQLADKIEAEAPKIYDIGVKLNSNYKSPILVLTCFSK